MQTQCTPGYETASGIVVHRGDLVRFERRSYRVGHRFRSTHDGLLHLELLPPYEPTRSAGWAYIGYITERDTRLTLVQRAPGEEPCVIASLRRDVAGLPVDEDYRHALLASIDRYREQILARPHFQDYEGWDDLEALQQVTLGDLMEASHGTGSRADE